MILLVLGKSWIFLHPQKGCLDYSLLVQSQVHMRTFKNVKEFDFKPIIYEGFAFEGKIRILHKNLPRRIIR